MLIILDTYTGEVISNTEFYKALHLQECINCNSKLGLQRQTQPPKVAVFSIRESNKVELSLSDYSIVYSLLPKYGRREMETLLMCKYCSYMYTIITRQHRIIKNRDRSQE